MPASRCALGITYDDDCYLGSDSLTAGVERSGPSGSTMTLQFATGTSGFKIWREKNGSRILNATGLIANGWQKQLTRAGTAFSAEDFLSSSQVKGRVCPPNVFLSFTNMTATGRCLYYDGGSPNEALDTGVNGIEASDWLRDWNRSDTSRGINSSYFEGNIKLCADKGMRLPVVYETTMTNPNSSLPNGDGLSTTPVWAGSTLGVPSIEGWTWTASAITYGFIYGRYFMWSGTGSAYEFYSSRATVRCVIP
jgi:hypothetical protein